MKNLILFATLLFIFSCGNTKTSEETPAINTKTTTAQVTEIKETATSTTSLVEKSADAKMEELKKMEKDGAIATDKLTPPKATAAVSKIEDAPKEVFESEKKKMMEEKNKETAKREQEEFEARHKGEKARKDMAKIKMNEEIAKRKAKEAYEAEKRRRAEEIKKSQTNISQKEKMADGLSGSQGKYEMPKVQLHDEWNSLLSKYVSSSGKVNYKGFKKDVAKLDKYLAKLEASKIGSWSRNKKMAFWINAYNAYTVKLIVKNYPVKSIMDLHEGKPWNVKWINLDGQNLSLNNIENDILRPKYKDARIHFAVNCAAKSCPPLLNQAWTESNLNRNFEKQAKAFINNSKFNAISNSSAKVSKIFEWYAVDFGNLVDYLNKYSTTKISSGTKVDYLEYDWGLNE